MAHYFDSPPPDAYNIPAFDVLVDELASDDSFEPSDYEYDPYISPEPEPQTDDEEMQNPEAEVRDAQELAHEWSKPKHDDKGDFMHPFVERDDELGNGDAPRTIFELRMCELSATIRRKPDWHLKKSSPDILKKWSEEALSAPLAEGACKEWALTPKAVEYVLEELDGYARLRDEETGIEIGCYERIYHSSNLISPSLRSSLLSLTSQLESVPEQEKDWHPGSDGKVLDLVHPSLYPIVYGKTLWRPKGEGKPKVIQAPKDEQIGLYDSVEFAWLPSDFKISADGKEAKLVSPYINNLHPDEQQASYRTLESIVARAVPLWDKVLSSLLHPLAPFRIKTVSIDSLDFDHKQFDVPCIWSDSETEEVKDVPYWDEHDEECKEFKGDRERWIRSLGKRVPEALEGYQGGLEKYLGKGREGEGTKTWEWEGLKGKKIQVIVKLANIHLTPPKEGEDDVGEGGKKSWQYPGGTWHVEGMQNERIVSTFIYYYDNENVTETSLAFRTAVVTPPYHQQDDSMCSRILWNMDRDEACVQYIGREQTSEGRCLAFPNIYQHQVQPFELADRTKPGHRKILALFLIDPTLSVPSATTVCPSQRHWYTGALSSPEASRFQTLPVELREMIGTQALEGTMTREEAEEVRARLMKERSVSSRDHTKQYFEAEFNMCEH